MVVDSFVNSIANDHLQVIGTELVLGKIYQLFNFPNGGCPDYFRHFFYAGWYIIVVNLSRYSSNQDKSLNLAETQNLLLNIEI
ncbi:MAG: hypothetical protein H6578_11730 [Chitinophagales bacterium]|nr:hypothetical protein [Chitinophagales bacterium]